MCAHYICNIAFRWQRSRALSVIAHQFPRESREEGGETQKEKHTARCRGKKKGGGLILSILMRNGDKELYRIILRENTKRDGRVVPYMTIDRLPVRESRQSKLSAGEIAKSRGRRVGSLTI